MRFILQLFVFSASLSVGSIAAMAALADRSPFLPEGFGTEQPPAPSSAAQPASELASLVDFKGFYEINGEFRLLIGKKRGQNASWLGVGESSEDLEVLDFDLDSERVRARLDGREGWVEMAQLGANPTTVAAATRPSGPVRTAPGQQATPPARRGVSLPGDPRARSPSPSVAPQDSRVRRPAELAQAGRAPAPPARQRIPLRRIERSTERPSVGPSVRVPDQRPSGPPPSPSPTAPPDSLPPAGTPAGIP